MSMRMREPVPETCIQPSMTTATGLLESLRIAKPCPADWDDMAGDDRTRHCATCDLDVHDLSALSRTDAEAFIRGRAGQRTCIQLWRRADGRVLTSDCPAGVRAAFRRVAWAASALLAAGFAAAAMLAPRNVSGVPQIAPVKQFHEFVQSHFGGPSVPAIAVKGDVCIPVPPSPGSAGTSAK
jgi:hypothetical protein